MTAFIGGLFFLFPLRSYGKVRKTTTPAYSRQEITDLKIAMGAYRDGLYSIAAGYLKNFLKKYPYSQFKSKVSLLLADAYLKTGNSRKALEIYKKILSKVTTLPDDTRLQIHYAMYEILKKRNPREAISHLKLMATLTFKKKMRQTVSFRAILELATFYQGKGNFQDAEKLLDNMLNLRPPPPWNQMALLKKAELLTFQKRYKTLYTLLEPVVHQNIKHMDLQGRDFYFYWALCNLQLKRYCVAQSVYKKLFSPFMDTSFLPAIINGYILSFTKCFADEHVRDKAFLSLYKTFQKRPSILFQIFYLEGLTYYREGHAQKAAKIWIKMLQTFPDHPMLSNILLKLNKIFLKNNRLKRWEDILLEINKDKKYLTETREIDNFLLGNLYFMQKKYETALPFYFSIINNKKYRKICLERIVLCYYYLQKFKETKTNLGILLLENPHLGEKPSIAFLQGDLALRSGKTETALKFFKKIIQGEKAVREGALYPWLTKAELEAGKIYFLKKDFNTARKYLMDVLKQATGNIEVNRLAAFYLGLISEKEGKPELSETYFQIASLSLNHAIRIESRFRLALAKKSLGFYKESEKIFKNIISSSPPAKDWQELSRLQLAELYILQKEFPNARTQIQYLIEKSKDPDIRKQAGKLLHMLQKKKS